MLFKYYNIAICLNDSAVYAQFLFCCKHVCKLRVRFLHACSHSLSFIFLCIFSETNQSESLGKVQERGNESLMRTCTDIFIIFSLWPLLNVDISKWIRHDENTLAYCGSLTYCVPAIFYIAHQTQKYLLHCGSIVRWFLGKQTRPLKSGFGLQSKRRCSNKIHRRRTRAQHESL